MKLLAGQSRADRFHVWPGLRFQDRRFPTKLPGELEQPLSEFRSGSRKGRVDDEERTSPVLAAQSGVAEKTFISRRRGG